ncbi:hypothetical protein D9M71_149450 [compost metagenome]
MAGTVGIDLDFAAIALDHDGAVAEQAAGIAVYGLVTGVEDTLQAAACAQRIEDAGQRVDRRAQAQGVAQVDHALQLRGPVYQRHERQALAVQSAADGLPVTAEWNLQSIEQLLGVKTPGGMGATTVHEGAHAVACQAFGSQQEPGQMTFLAGIGRPVDVHRHGRRLQALAQGLGEACELFGAFFLVPQQHQKRTELSVFDRFIEQHAHGFAGFFAGQAAGAALAFAEDAHELRERVFGRGFGDQGAVVVHMQLVGLGRPASLAASLAGVPLNK